jgi:hypothetical protein
MFVFKGTKKMFSHLSTTDYMLFSLVFLILLLFFNGIVLFVVKSSCHEMQVELDLIGDKIFNLKKVVSYEESEMMTMQNNIKNYSNYNNSMQATTVHQMTDLNTALK